MTRRLPRLCELRAAWWAFRALRAARGGLAAGELVAVPMPAPASLPSAAVRGVEVVLRRRRHTCLEGALVRQRWLAAHGVRRDVVVGVTAPSTGFEAHAWVDGPVGPCTPAPWHELTRLKP